MTLYITRRSITIDRTGGAIVRYITPILKGKPEGAADARLQAADAREPAEAATVRAGVREPEWSPCYTLEFRVPLAHPVLMESHPPLSARRAFLASHWVLIAILVICVAIEAALQGADFGLWGSPRWRGLAYQYGGFWRGLLGNWRPNYAAQPAAMFASYGFLHGGFVHLLVNMITLLSLGRLVIERVGQGRFAVIYALSLLGGAVSFAALSDAVQPMVGASGALFGLAGVLTGWEYTARRLAHERMGPVLRVIGLLVGLNIVMYWAMGGNLAWETHLGGFLAGWAAGWWVREHPG